MTIDSNKLYSLNGQHPQPLPNRIRLKDSSTRTDKTTFTEQELEDCGYVAVNQHVEFENGNQKEVWNGKNYEVVDMTQEELDQRIKSDWEEVVATKKSRLEQLQWRISRYKSEIRLGLEPTDDIDRLNKHVEQINAVPDSGDSEIDIDWPQGPYYDS